jgi:hypothetical protein
MNEGSIFAQDRKEVVLFEASIIRKLSFGCSDAHEHAGCSLERLCKVGRSLSAIFVRPCIDAVGG